MHQRLKKVYFILVTAAFIILAPVFGFYIAGYRFDGQANTVVRAGGFSCSTNPRGATVSLNGRAYGKSPIRITNLTPGVYNATIALDNYQTVQLTVQIASGHSTLFDDIVLFRNDQSAQTVWTGPAELLSVSSTQEYFATNVMKADERKLTVYPLSTATTPLWSVSLPGKPEEMLWSPHARRLAVRYANGGQPTCVFNRSDGSCVDIDALVQDQVIKLWWSPDSDDLLYASTKKATVLVDLYDSIVRPIIEPAAIKGAVRSNGAYFIIPEAASNDLVWYDRAANQTTSLAEIIGTPESLWDSQSEWFGITYAFDERCTVYQRTGRTTLLAIPINESCSFLNWSTDSRFLLTGDDYELRRLNIAAGETSVITRQSKPYARADWYQSSDTIVLTSTDAIQINTRLDNVTIQTAIFVLHGAQNLGFDPEGRALLLLRTVDSTMTLERLTVR